MFRQFFTSLFVKPAPIFWGRWKLKYDEKQINQCVLWANKDNCGCSKIEESIIDEDVSDDFYLPYIM